MTEQDWNNRLIQRANADGGLSLYPAQALTGSPEELRAKADASASAGNYGLAFVQRAEAERLHGVRVPAIDVGGMAGVTAPAIDVGGMAGVTVPAVELVLVSNRFEAMEG